MKEEQESSDGASSTKLHSKHAAIFFIALAVLIGVLLLGLWIANQYSHFLDR